MDQTPDELMAQVRAKRLALDNDLELLRLRTRAAARAADLGARLTGLTRATVAVAIGAATVFLWGRRRRALRNSTRNESPRLTGRG